MRVFFFTYLLFSYLCSAQVGIGTESPQADLHVAGDVLVQTGFKTAQLANVPNTEEDFKLLTRVTNSDPIGEVTQLNVNNLSVAPVNTVNYHFTNLDGDDVTDVDLLYRSDKYVVAVANFQYIGDAVIKTDINKDTKSQGTFLVRTFESGGSWHLQMGNTELDPAPGATVIYRVTLVVYSKAYYRELPVITTNLGGSNTGTASSIPNLY